MDGVIALLGSGETAPGMVKVHRSLLARYQRPVAINLDTSYGFQENVPQMSAKLVEFFATSLQMTLETVPLANYESASHLARAIAKRRVREADYIFAGPGSPSYALAQWRPLGLVEDFAAALGHGATLCLASAATLTLGSHSAPIYEIYKVGTAPHWLEGLDLLGRVGLHCAVIPHYDNAEGRDYDTRRCYLGERRLALLEAQLPEDVAILGIDEHTALILDLEADTARVLGRGHAYWRRGGEVRVLGRDAPTPLDALRAGSRPTTIPAPAPVPSDQYATIADAAVAASNGDADALAALVLASGHASTPASLVEAVLDARAAARASAQYELADRLRDGLVEAGVEVRDDPNGTTWHTRPR